MKIEVVQIEGRRMAIRSRGLEVIIDDTIEAGGPGDGFRPGELLLGALGACMIGTMLTFAKNQDIEILDVVTEVEGATAEHPERYGSIAIEMKVRAAVTERQAASLRRVASACKIHNTLAAGPELNLTFTVEE